MITKILWIVIILFIVMSFVIDIVEAAWFLLFIIGIGALIFGILLISSDTFMKLSYRSVKKDESYKNLFSDKSRYFLDRYYSGIRFITGGIVLIAIYWITHQQLFAASGAWLARVF